MFDFAIMILAEAMVPTLVAATVASLLTIVAPIMLKEYEAARYGAKLMLIGIAWPVTFPVIIYFAIVWAIKGVKIIHRELSAA